ncbi:MAG TPA: carbamoyltransferase HypF [Gallionellaceae bacterium]
MPPSMPEARRWLLGGRVQGVGFRPFVFRLAQRLALPGRVQNLAGQVLIEAEGEPAALDAFAAALLAEAPPLARPLIGSVEKIAASGWKHFEIVDSARTADAQVHVPPDYFLCDDCRREMLTPGDRRYRYPFINCTQCGPRYTLMRSLPYDRASTSMASFDMCPACRAEYENPRDRRFHAEPIACPQCGPQLQWVTGEARLAGDAALQAAIAALQRGDILAVKGVGGYHLLCDATHAHAVERLRQRKRRPHKPLALMFPWQGEDGCAAVRSELALDAQAHGLLTDPLRPILLLPRRPDSTLPQQIAPGLREIGAMLPYSPLHHLLLEGLGRAVVATSANLSGEPVLTVNAEVEARLAQVADAFLHHNRPIVRPADDTVMRVVAGKPRLLRAGRGIAPQELELPRALARPTLAVGGHTKNTIALGWGKRVVLSPHIGDLDALRSMEVFEQVIADLEHLYGVEPQAIVCDAHSQYGSSRWAAGRRLPLRRVWHHHSHASALALEHDPGKTWLTFTWDGVGLGEDDTLWGGEALHGRPGAWQRVARLRPFRLPGGERAGREPWRSAAALCWESGLERTVPVADPALLRSAWERGLNAPPTSAAGRLFDAAASLLGLLDHASFEGQGGMYLENVAAGPAEAIALPLRTDAGGLLTADWQPLLPALLRDEVAVETRAMQFHLSLVHSLVAQAQRIRAQRPFDVVGLTGGVFQNKLLAELALAQLAAAGFAVHLPERVPCNDGGIAVGQLVEALFSNE